MGTEKAVPLHGDHLQIAKYGSPQDENFKIVSAQLSKLVEEVT